jgi:hypothetical protein
MDICKKIYHGVVSDVDQKYGCFEVSFNTTFFPTPPIRGAEGNLLGTYFGSAVLARKLLRTCLDRGYCVERVPGPVYRMGAI